MMFQVPVSWTLLVTWLAIKAGSLLNGMKQVDEGIWFFSFSLLYNCATFLIVVTRHSEVHNALCKKLNTDA
jgi:hypothetical protein